MGLRIRHYLPLLIGGLCLGAAVALVARDQLVAAAVAAAGFGVVLLAVATHVLARIGSNYRQLRSEHDRLQHELRTIEMLVRQTREAAETARIEDAQLLEVMDEMTPIITQTVARDWSINADRIAARYEEVEAELRRLLDPLEARAAGLDGAPREDAGDRNGAGRSRFAD